MEHIGGINKKLMTKKQLLTKNVVDYDGRSLSTLMRKSKDEIIKIYDQYNNHIKNVSNLINEINQYNTSELNSFKNKNKLDNSFKVYKTNFKLNNFTTEPKYVDDEEDIYDFMKNIRHIATYIRNILNDNNFTGNVRFIYKKNDIEIDTVFDFGDNVSDWFRDGEHFWNFINTFSYGDSMRRKSFFYVDKNDINKINQKLIITNEVDISPNTYIQHFKHGISNCLLTPIINKFTELYENVKSIASKRRYKSLINKTQTYIEKYKDGVPECDLQSICNDIKVNINIYNVFKKEYKLIKSNKKPLTSLKYINTRLDHVDNIVSLDSDIELCNSSSEMDEIINNLNTTNEWFICKKSLNNITKIYTLNKTYKLYTNLDKTLDEFNKSENVKHMLECTKINNVKHRQLSRYILDSKCVGGSVRYKDSQTADHHIDMVKSYTQFSSCDYYMGFPSVISDFRKINDALEYNQYREFLSKNLGLYTIYNINYNNSDENVKKHLQTLNILNDEETHTSPYLIFLIDLGITFKISHGCWSVGKHDFKFTDEMLDKNISGGPYKKWCGMLGYCSEYETYYISCKDENDAAMYANDKTKVFYCNYTKTARLLVKNEFEYHNSLLLSYITAYSRISTFIQLFKIKHENVVRVMLDGIFYNGPDVELISTFINKSFDKIPNINFDSFYNSYNFIYPDSDFKYTEKQTLCYGAGGCGKTHDQLSDIGFMNIVYVAPSWKLIASKKSEFPDITCVTYQKLIGNNTFGLFQVYTPGVIVLDEITMISNKTKQDIIKLYPNSKLIWCGDIDTSNIIYQLPPPVDVKPIKFKNIHNIHYNKNYRTTDIKLLKVLKFTRKLIKKYDGQNVHPNVINNSITKLLNDRIVDNEFIYNNYEINDWILCSKHIYIDEWTELLSKKFTKDKKWLITKNNKELCNGDIIISSSDMPNCVERYAFTCHACQGLTIKNEKIFIDTRRLFDIRMFYVALSRAKSIDQIYLFC